MRKRISILSIAACTFFAGCERPPSAESRSGKHAPSVLETMRLLDVKKCTPRKPSIPKTTEACKAAGGSWYTDELGGCVLPTTDAGKDCQDSSCCEGRCLAERGIRAGTLVVGKCAAATETDCFNAVENGRTRGTICY